MRVRFGEFVFDTEVRRLEKSGTAVPLSPKAFELLTILIAERPRAVTKDVLIDRLWPDVVVVEANLPNLIAEIRRALSESGAATDLIRTVRRFGYAFSADAVELPPPDATPVRCTFELRLADRRTPLLTGINILGRGPESSIPIADAGVSRRHARIVVSDGAAVIEDLGSRNGTFVDGQRISAAVTLHEGNRIHLAANLVRVFHVLPEPERTVSLPGYPITDPAADHKAPQS